MSYHQSIQSIIEKEFKYDIWSLAEALADLREESDRRINELEEEIKNHEC